MDLAKLKPRKNVLSLIGLVALIVAFSFMCANFIALQSVRLAAKYAVENEISALSPHTAKSALELQSVAAQFGVPSEQENKTQERFYFVADRSKNPISGSWTSWPEGTGPYNGWHTFPLDEAKFGGGQAYGRVFDLKDAKSKSFYKVLIARRMAEPGMLFSKIFPILLSLAVLAFATGVFALRTFRERPQAR
jgi:GH43 family beta-xylosidase